MPPPFNVSQEEKIKNKQRDRKVTNPLMTTLAELKPEAL